jgi:purine-nucleoside phosphorylase
VVGYVCTGRALGSLGAGSVVAVRDHVGLTWRSPLMGPNEDRLGPRFPVLEGLYVPEVVRQCLEPSWDVAVEVVAGVEDDGRLTEFEAEAVAVSGIEVASQELVPVALLAAHLGIRLAAAVVIIERESEKGDG